MRNAAGPRKGFRFLAHGRFSVVLPENTVRDLGRFKPQMPPTVPDQGDKLTHFTVFSLSSLAFKINSREGENMIRRHVCTLNQSVQQHPTRRQGAPVLDGAVYPFWD